MPKPFEIVANQIQQYIKVTIHQYKVDLYQECKVGFLIVENQLFNSLCVRNRGGRPYSHFNNHKFKNHFSKGGKKHLTFFKLSANRE